MATEILPATPDRWHDLENLFGARGACGGCWCMAWRLPRAQFDKQKGELNKRALLALVNRERAPGVLAYVDGAAAGWCAVAPREEFVRLARSRIFQPLDAQPVWSVTCFFVAKAYRKRGLTVELLRGAVEYARIHGATVVEGYPFDLAKEMPAAFVWTGLASSFRAAGFIEAIRRSANRPVMRWCPDEANTRWSDG